MRSVGDVLRHLKAGEFGLVVEGLSEGLGVGELVRGGADGEGDLEVRRRSLVLEGGVGGLGEVEGDGGEGSGGGDGRHV